MPYAIIRTGGKQYRVEPGKTYRIPSLVGDAGAKVTFSDVLLGNDGNNTHVGVPGLKGASVAAEIVKHGRGEKIIVFKQKRRKNYARKQGHRQGFTEIKIGDITLARGLETMAHKKGVGSTRNGRDSNAQYRGVKKFGGERVVAGNIIVRQCGTKWHPGRNVGLGSDFTIYSLIDGVVKFEHKSKTRYKISVYPQQPAETATA